MAVPTTLHIGRPRMECTPICVRGPGGGGGAGHAGLSPCRGLGEEGEGGDTRIRLGGGGLQRVPQGLAVSGPALHEAFSWTARGMARQPRSGGPPTFTGARARCPLRWPLC